MAGSRYRLANWFQLRFKVRDDLLDPAIQELVL